LKGSNRHNSNRVVIHSFSRFITLDFTYTLELMKSTNGHTQIKNDSKQKQS